MLDARSSTEGAGKWASGLALTLLLLWASPESRVHAAPRKATAPHRNFTVAQAAPKRTTAPQLTAAAHARVASESAGFWLTAARKELRRARPERARAAFLRALQLDPSNGAAMQGLLWVLIEQPDRPALARALQHFAGAARRDAQLWRSYAAGLCLLGRYAEALPWFARGARLPAGDMAADASERLWLADWVLALSRSGHRRAADKLRTLALRELQRAARERSRQGTASLRVRLAALTADKLRRWELDDEFLAGCSDRLRAAAFLEGAGQDAADADPAAEEQDSAASIDDSEGSAGSETAAAAPEDDDADEEDEPTATAASPLSLQRPAHRLGAVAAYELHSLGGLLIHSALVAVTGTLRHWELGLRAGYTYLDTAGGRLGFQDPSLSLGEFDVAAVLRLRPRSGFFEAMVGGNLRRELSIPYAAARGLYYFGHGVSLHGEVGLNQLTEDTLGLRVLGARDRVLAGLTVEPLRLLYFVTELDWHGYWSRSRESLGDGFAGYLETGYRSHFGPLSFDLRASGFYEYNRLAADLPEDLCDRLLDRCADTGIEDVVLPSYAMVGGGPRLRYGLPGPAASGGGSGRLFAYLDGWLGALLHADTPGAAVGQTSSVGYDLQLGIGVQLPRGAGRLSASGYLSNSRSGGFEGTQWGVGVRYTR